MLRSSPVHSHRPNPLGQPASTIHPAHRFPPSTRKRCCRPLPPSGSPPGASAWPHPSRRSAWARTARSPCRPTPTTPAGTPARPPQESGATRSWPPTWTTTGPAAFYSLGALRIGDHITVQRRDGRDAVFTVTAMSVYAKQTFPSQAVYGPTAHPQLTLITCADWDQDARTYRANLVITAHPSLSPT
ncbi:sortase domain-bontaining protein [Streptomyces sp. HMX112]|uniref:sortase domain-containing protein n=1 Tax=Streptomyces sp. HMX112 TaxID=3390850 RepID=UPI003A811085